ncbi:MAG TPA: rod shape-determining protein MreC [Vicinamibacterales bacterium]|jgi:rod shape-determining protein MreC
MAVLDIRRRTGYFFLAVVVGHVILISTQVTTKRGVPMLEAAVFGVFSEVQRAANSVTMGVRGTWQNYFALQQVRTENEQLKQQLGELQVRLQEERNMAQQYQALQKLLELKTGTPLMTTGAGVIAGGASPEFRTMTIDKGTHDGLRADMAVISPAGVVGRVIQPSPRAAKVQLLIDRNAAAGALIERTRAQGVVVGTGADQLRMDYVSGSSEVKAGDTVVTSGIDGIYPKGFVIGQIQSVSRGAGQYSSIVIKPAVDFTSLEAVLIVLTPPPAATEATGTAGANQGRE